MTFHLLNLVCILHTFFFLRTWMQGYVWSCHYRVIIWQEEHSLYTPCVYTPDFVSSSRSTGTSVRRRSASSPPCCSCSSAACCLWRFQRPSLNTSRAGPRWSLCTLWSSPWPPLDLGTLWQVIKDQHRRTLVCSHSVLSVHRACRSHFLDLLTVMTVSIFSCVQAVQK